MYKIDSKVLQDFHAHLINHEYSPSTIRKYLYDIQVFVNYVNGEIREKGQLVSYREYLRSRGFAARSINSMIASVNALMSMLGSDWRIKGEKIQKECFVDPTRHLTKEDYEKMVRFAEAQNNIRLALILQTLCSLGIRVSELSGITFECLSAGCAVIRNKGKVRTIIIPDNLAEKLTAYCMDKGITAGPVFISRYGNPLDRSNIWKMIKKIGEMVKIAAEKVFPHNLRHLFARTHYAMYNDPLHLADILGHSSVDTTRIYTVNSADEERQQIARLGLVI